MACCRCQIDNYPQVPLLHAKQGVTDRNWFICIPCHVVWMDWNKTVPRLDHVTPARYLARLQLFLEDPFA